MRVEVLYFASLAERAGTKGETLEITPGADVAALWELVRARHPAIAPAGFRPMAACDMRYAPFTRPLDGVREVAFLPPVSGG